MPNIISSSEKSNLNHNEEPPPITRVVKNKKIENSAGNVVEQLELSYTAGRTYSYPKTQRLYS